MECKPYRDSEIASKILCCKKMFRNIIQYEFWYFKNMS